MADSQHSSDNNNMIKKVKQCSEEFNILRDGIYKWQKKTHGDGVVARCTIKKNPKNLPTPSKGRKQEKCQMNL